MLEPARFGCVYLLVRAYQYSGNETYPAFFWRLLARIIHESQTRPWDSLQNVL